MSDKGISAEQFELSDEWGNQVKATGEGSWYAFAEAYAAARLREVEGERDRLQEDLQELRKLSDLFAKTTSENTTRLEAERDRLKAALERCGNEIGRPVPDYYDAAARNSARKNLIAEVASIIAAALTMPSPRPETIIDEKRSD